MSFAVAGSSPPSPWQPLSCYSTKTGVSHQVIIWVCVSFSNRKTDTCMRSHKHLKQFDTNAHRCMPIHSHSLKHMDTIRCDNSVVGLSWMQFESQLKLLGHIREIYVLFLALQFMLILVNKANSLSKWKKSRWWVVYSALLKAPPFWTFLHFSIFQQQI